MGWPRITQLSAFALLSLLLPGCSDSVPPCRLAPGLAPKMEGPVSVRLSCTPPSVQQSSLKITQLPR